MSQLTQRRVSITFVFLVLLFGVVGFAAKPVVAHAQADDQSTTNCLGAAAFPLNDLCVTVNYNYVDSQDVQISSVIECVDVMGPAVYASMQTHLDVYSAGPDVWSGDGSVLIYGPIGADSEQCAWFWPWTVVQSGYNGVWVEATGLVCNDFNPEDTTPCALGSDTPPQTISPEWVGASNFS